MAVFITYMLVVGVGVGGIFAILLHALLSDYRLLRTLCLHSVQEPDQNV